jgi:hypothetical protein
MYERAFISFVLYCGMTAPTVLAWMQDGREITFESLNSQRPIFVALQIITICSIKRKDNFFSLFFLAREQKNSGNKLFLFIGHEVLLYETPFLHRARRNYVCGAIRKQ